MPNWWSSNFMALVAAAHLELAGLPQRRETAVAVEAVAVYHIENLGHLNLAL
jgi:hypothetical protein